MYQELAVSLNDYRYELMRDSDKRFRPNLTKRQEDVISEAIHYLDLAIDELMLLKEPIEEHS